jgi:hypothetical protein
MLTEVTKAEAVAETRKDEGSPPESSRRDSRSSRSLRVKSLTALVASVAGLLVSASAFYKPRDDRATQHSYETLSQEMKTMSEENVRQHDDLVSLHAYLEGFVHAYESTYKPKEDAGASPSATPTTTVMAKLAAPGPPVLAPRPRPLSPPTFAKVKGEANLL